MAKTSETGTSGAGLSQTPGDSKTDCIQKMMKRRKRKKSTEKNIETVKKYLTQDKNTLMAEQESLKKKPDICVRPKVEGTSANGSAATARHGKGKRSIDSCAKSSDGNGVLHTSNFSLEAQGYCVRLEQNKTGYVCRFCYSVLTRGWLLRDHLRRVHPKQYGPATLVVIVKDGQAHPWLPEKNFSDLLDSISRSEMDLLSSENGDKENEDKVVRIVQLYFLLLQEIERQNSCLKHPDGLKCQECGKQMASLIAYRRHCRGHSDILYKCSVCGFSANKKQYVKGHIKGKHNLHDVEPIRCFKEDVKPDPPNTKPDSLSAAKLNVSAMAEEQKFGGKRRIKSEGEPYDLCEGYIEEPESIKVPKHSTQMDQEAVRITKAKNNNSSTKTLGMTKIRPGICSTFRIPYKKEERK